MKITKNQDLECREEFKKSEKYKVKYQHCTFHQINKINPYIKLGLETPFLEDNIKI